MVGAMLLSVAMVGQNGSKGVAADAVIPHNQQRAPGPALTPEEAIAKMQVPPGFSVEVVASEPQVVNPVAMAIDERGRFWITESFEYPRQSPGPGRDRIKILEDTDQDGKIDQVKIFAEGLNIPSGIAVGHGGVWVANSPDILFLQDTDGDDRADKQEVIVTGFGRTDTHELPNSLTWGPDGWLYGLNGVFNYSHVKHRGKEFDFTCVLFRIHPKTREFQLFCEGTSNPWGIAYDSEGQAFVSACVIDHLWHLVESGYYHRQGGPYPPYTWKMESIVEHTHQMAAYCGITWFDSDAYPEAFREKLYMGNIHGGCINVDRLERRGATYRGLAEPDFLTANDAWFMPVVQKTGPDGCLYVLDWYDRYHCYQDANRDPEGIDRGKGRLYRVRYGQSPRAPRMDLAKESDDQLIERLGSANVFLRETAQRLLAERGNEAVRQKLANVVLDGQRSRKMRSHALWALISSGTLPEEVHEKLLKHEDAMFRAFAVRAAGNQGKVSDRVRSTIRHLAHDPSPDVQLQFAIASPKLSGDETLAWLLDVLQASGDDPILPHVVWQNLYPRLDREAAEFVAQTRQIEKPSEGMSRLLPQAIRRLLDDPALHGPLANLLAHVAQQSSWDSREASLGMLRVHWLAYGAPADGNDVWHRELLPTLLQVRGDSHPAVAREAMLLAAMLGERAAKDATRSYLKSAEVTDPGLADAMAVLGALEDPVLLDYAKRRLAEVSGDNDESLVPLLDAMGRLHGAQVAELTLTRFDKIPSPQRPRATELLMQRPVWAIALLDAIAQEKLPRETLHVNQVRRLQNSQDSEVRQRVANLWGRVREERNPQVEQAIEGVRQLWSQKKGDPHQGQAVFRKTCAQCHQIYGQGEQVGPDITRNGRASFEQLLSNVFDPNLVVGAAYQAHTVITQDGRNLSGLLVEQSPERVVLKLQGGKVETIAANQIDEMTVSPLSLMPEGWEKQLNEQELIDLLSFLVLEGPPDQTGVAKLPGTPE